MPLKMSKNLRFSYVFSEFPYYFALENIYLLLKLTTLTPNRHLHDSKFFWPVVYDVLAAR